MGCGFGLRTKGFAGKVGIIAQGLKPRSILLALSARLKSCPDTGRSLQQFSQSYEALRFLNAFEQSYS